MDHEILVTRRGAVMAIGINRPQKKNALTAAMYAAMADALKSAQADEAIRVVIFHGTADAFTAGNDLEDFLQRPPVTDDAPVFQFLLTVTAFDKPLVAAVNGVAVGLGTTLLFHCDLVYAADNARFSLPFTQLGLVPEFGSSLVLPLIAGHQRAAELILLGEPFDAQKAQAAGFITRVLPAGDVQDAAWTAAEKLAALPRKSVQTARALMRAAQRPAIEAHLREESLHFRAMLTEPAAKEAFAAFLAKRKPDFTGL